MFTSEKGEKQRPEQITIMHNRAQLLSNQSQAKLSQKIQSTVKLCVQVQCGNLKRDVKLCEKENTESGPLAVLKAVREEE